MEFSYLNKQYTIAHIKSIPFIDFISKKTYNLIKNDYQYFACITISAGCERCSYYMKRINTKDLVPGMITAEDVYSYSNQLILQKGLVLTDKTITKLEFYSILSIRVEDGLSASTPVIPVVDNRSYSERVQASEEFKEYKKKFESTVSSFKGAINDIVEKNAPIDADALLKNTLSLLENKNGKVNVFTMLHNMRMYDDLTYTHCLNVALICNVFAHWLHYSEEDVNTATLCGLLHDTGKMMIPDSIIKKPDKLTNKEYEIVKIGRASCRERV